MLPNRKPKTCAECGAKYMPRNSLQKVCSAKCAYQHGKRVDFNARTRQLRRQTREQDVSWWKKQAQIAVNSYVRERDKGPCISCGDMIGKREAGHFRSIAAASQLRYNVLNIHVQCSQCNSSKSGNLLHYRSGLVRKIGPERVQALENDSRIRRYSIEYLRRLTGIYRRKAKLYRKLRDNP